MKEEKSQKRVVAKVSTRSKKIALNTNESQRPPKISRPINKTKLRKIKMAQDASTDQSGSLGNLPKPKLDKKVASAASSNQPSIPSRRPNKDNYIESSLFLSRSFPRELGVLSEYLDDIGSYLLEHEKNRLIPHFEQSNLDQERVRVCGIKYISNFCFLNQLSLETQFLAFDLFYLMLTTKGLMNYDLHLKVAVSIFIAAKYHEKITFTLEHIWNYPNLKNVHKDNVLILESEVLQLIKFNLNRPSALQFIDLLVLRYNIPLDKREMMIQLSLEAVLDKDIWIKQPSLLAMTSLSMVLTHAGQKAQGWLEEELNWRVQKLKKIAKF